MGDGSSGYAFKTVMTRRRFLLRHSATLFGTTFRLDAGTLGYIQDPCEILGLADPLVHQTPDASPEFTHVSLNFYKFTQQQPDIIKVSLWDQFNRIYSYSS